MKMNTTQAQRPPKRIKRWFDRHHHLRREKMLKLMLPYLLQQKARGAVIMGNLAHPFETSTIAKARAHKAEIEALLPPGSDFKVVMTCYLTDHITPDEIEQGFREGVWNAAKLYMADQNGQGGTTGSQHGVRNLLGLYPVFERMQTIRMPLLGHFEAVERYVDEFDREIVSGERDLLPITRNFPGLVVVVEHVTDGRMADIVADLNHPIYATVTPQAMLINRNDLFWGGLTPINYCKPVAKREEHRLRVRAHVTMGKSRKRFGAGTDSAPHDETMKCRPCGCAAGIVTSPHAVELYTVVFEEVNAPDNHLEDFLSRNFIDIYGLRETDKTMLIEPIDNIIPLTIGDREKDGHVVHLFWGGKNLGWKLAA